MKATVDHVYPAPGWPTHAPIQVRQPAYWPEGGFEEPARPAATVPIASKRILCIDHDADYALLLRSSLELVGHQVLIVADPKNALRALSLTPDAWDLLITGFQMPGLNFFDLAKIVRERHPCLRYVIVASRFGYNTIEAATLAGITHLYEKPTEPDQFVALVASALG